MAGKYGEHNKVRCSFCNKSEDQVRKLIAGPEGVYICDECIEIMSSVRRKQKKLWPWLFIIIIKESPLANAWTGWSCRRVTS